MNRKRKNDNTISRKRRWGYLSLHSCVGPSKQHILSLLQLLHLSQTHRRRDPNEADQSPHLLPHPDRVASNIQARNRPFQRFRSAVIVSVSIASGDAQDRIFNVAIILFFHRLGGFALPLALGAVLAEDVAGEDFDFRDEVGRMAGVLEHSVDEVFLVAGDLISIGSILALRSAKKKGVGPTDLSRTS